MSMVRYIHMPEAASSSIFDFSGLDSLKQGVAAGANAPADAQKKVAHQFEALFIQQFLKQARQASTLTGAFESEQTKMARSMADEQLALQLANPGIGLAKALLAQIQASGAHDGKPGAEAAGAAAPASSRVPGMRSELGADTPDGVPSISALISMLNGGALAVGAVKAVQEAPQKIRDFVSRMSGAAHEAASQSGVPAKLILSQAALESGWGEHEIRGQDGQDSHNLFGIKASADWKGKVVNVLTTEYVNGEARIVVQPFRAYDSYADAFADYARLIGQSPRYKDVVTAPTAEDAARQIQSAGYATDPSYASKLISIMGYFDASGGAAG
jgi:flagellar protein FlgJ